MLHWVCTDVNSVPSVRSSSAAVTADRTVGKSTKGICSRSRMRFISSATLSSLKKDVMKIKRDTKMEPAKFRFSSSLRYFPGTRSRQDYQPPFVLTVKSATRASDTLSSDSFFASMDMRFDAVKAKKNTSQNRPSFTSVIEDGEILVLALCQFCCSIALGLGRKLLG